MSIQIVYGDESYFEGFWRVLDSVAREQVYLEIIEAPPFTEVCEFQRKLITKKFPVFYALEGEKVCAWLDIVIPKNPRQSHRGSLGMGVEKAHRGQGLGSRLMEKAIPYAKSIGLEQIELQVYTNNTQAIELYKKFGFQETGLTKNFRKLDGRSFDSIHMQLFL